MFEKVDGVGLNYIILENLDLFGDITEKVHLLPSDILWKSGKWLKIPLVPGWNVFMENIVKNKSFQRSRIIPMPFVNLPPSNYDTIYTVLCFAIEKLSLINNTCIVTFDQPLYMKARDIITMADQNSKLSKTIVRLGSFNLLMSFMGSIGYIMGGSGLKELLSVIYAPISVDKMLTGYAYARAIRGHF